MSKKLNPATPVRPAWLTEDCPNWCAYPGEHAGRDMYDDRSHSGEAGRILLTAEEPMTSEKPGGGIEVYDDPSHMDVYMIQHYREAGPRIWIGRDGSNVGMHLSIADAEQLITELRARVDAAAKA